MSENPFGNLELRGIKLPDFSDQIRNMDKIHDSMVKAQAAEYQKEEKYKADVLETLKSIEANTIGLTEIIPLLSVSIEKQDEILEFLRGSLAISASETTEEAEGKLRQMMTKAATLSTDIETVQKLTGFAHTVFKMYVKMSTGAGE